MKQRLIRVLRRVLTPIRISQFGYSCRMYEHHNRWYFVKHWIVGIRITGKLSRLIQDIGI